MKAKIKEGEELLFSQGASNNWKDLKDEIIINFNDKGTFISYRQKKNRLIISTLVGTVVIVFTGAIPVIDSGSYNKDQLILNFKK
jgi:hypothetical protein